MSDSPAVPEHVRTHNRNDSDVTEFSRFSSESTVNSNPPPSKRLCSFNFLSKLKKSLLSWRKRDKNKKHVLPLSLVEAKKKKKKRECWKCVLITILIWLLLGNIIALDVVYFRSPVLQTNNITTLLNGNGSDTSNSPNSPNSPNSSAPAPEQNIKAVACLSLFGSVPPKDFNCGFCADSQAFYNVTTFCALKFIWANAFNQTEFESVGWMGNNFFCGWGGVTCDESFNIIGLDLQPPFYVNTFGSSLENLGTLRQLTIEGTGKIPTGELPRIFQSKNLENLTLTTTAFTGTIPNTIDKMTSLKSLKLRGNILLNDSIPDTISLTSIRIFVYSFATLNGEIPDFIGNSKTLQTSLVALDLSSNKYTGKIPDSLMNLSNLRSLNLGINNLSGEPLPSLISSKFAKSLLSLGLGSNRFTGIIPTSVNQFVNLIDFNLEVNKFFGPIPIELTTIKSLTGMRLNQNRLSGSIPNPVGDMPLIQLQLFNNTLTGDIPINICSRNYLSCTLAGNQFTNLPANCSGCEL